MELWSKIGNWYWTASNAAVWVSMEFGHGIEVKCRSVFPSAHLPLRSIPSPLRSVFRRNWPALFSVPIFPRPALLKRVSPFILVRRAHLQRRDRAEQHARGGRRPPSLCRASASPNLRRAPLRVGRPYALSSLRRELQGASAPPRVAASALALRRESRGGGTAVRPAASSPLSRHGGGWGAGLEREGRWRHRN